MELDINKAKPILFNTAMVEAILDGRKCCTRRIIKPQPKGRLSFTFAGADNGTWGYPPDGVPAYWGDDFLPPENLTDEDRKKRWKPPYRADDILYVRETWHKYTKRIGEGENCHLAEFYGYKASVAKAEDADEPWKPSIHMPKEAARIFLKVTNVRVEQLQEITEDEAIKEGIYQSNCKECNASFGCDACCDEGYNEIDEFADLWNSTVKKSDLDRYGWEANPWVWVIEFERVK